MKRLLLLLFGLFIAVAPCQAETITLQPDAAAGVDTIIINTSATTNYGTNVGVNTGEHDANTYVVRGLIKFDLATLPATAILDSVQLKLKVAADYSSNARTLRVFRLKRTWLESEATWNVWTTGNNWSTAGAFHVDDCEQTDIGSVALSATEAVDSVITITLTPRTKAALDLGNGWLLKMDTEANDLYNFNSSDYATASYRPQLVINYHLMGNSVIIVQ